jgi:hypothetical protein
MSAPVGRLTSPDRRPECDREKGSLAMRWRDWVGAAAVLFAAGGDAAAWQVGNWIGRTVLTDNGALAGCRMSVAYDSGVTLHFMHLKNGALLIAMSDRGWSLHPNGTYGMNLSIDGRFVRRARGIVLDAMRDAIFLDLGRDRTTRALLQRGQQLSLADGKRTYDFRLNDTGAAFARLADCVRTGA